MSALDPILPGFYPDPSICRVGEDYYLVTSSFHYFPGVPIFHSRDLVNWTQIGHCLTRPEQLPLADAKTSAGIYAPTLRCHDGVFYMVTTNVSRQKHFVVTSQDPAGDWSDPVWIESPVVAENGSRGIDPSLFFEADATALFSWTTGVAGGNQMLQAPLDLRTGDLLDEPKEIWKGTGGQHTEAPHLYQINGLYYLVLAEGGTSYGHMVTIARSETPWGPWESCPHNPILTHRSLDIPVQATGHGDLVQTPEGEWWMVYLGVRPDMGHPRAYHLGRETFIAPVAWESGWPVVGDAGRVTGNTRCPPVTNEYRFDQPWMDTFTSSVFKPEWNFLRNPHPENYRIASGELTLTGTAVTLDEPQASPTWIGRRQQHLRCRIDVSLQSEGTGEVGIVAYMDEWHHYEIFLWRDQETSEIVVRRRVGDLQVETLRKPWSASSASLFIQADKDVYRLGVDEDSVLDQGKTRYLSTEVAQGFTGVYLACFAQGPDVTAKVKRIAYTSQDIPHFLEQDEEIAFKDRGYPNPFDEVPEFLTGLQDWQDNPSSILLIKNF